MSGNVTRGKTTLSATSKKNKKKHPRTFVSPNRTTSAERYKTPNPTGMGSPLVLVWDSTGRLLLDLVQVSEGYYNLALEKFTYEFKEKEEDKCTITFSSQHLELMDNLKLYKGQKLLVSWGYMDGNLRPPINIVVIDTKEKYNEKGFSMTIIGSDNLSFFSRGKSPLLVKLEGSIEGIKDLLTPNTKDIGNDIATLRGWKAWNWGDNTNFQYGKGYAYTTGPVKSTDKFPMVSEGQITNYFWQLQDYYRRTFQAKGGQGAIQDSLPTHTMDISTVQGVFKKLGTIYDYSPLDFQAGLADGKLIALGEVTGGSNIGDMGIPRGPTSDDPPPIPDFQPNVSSEDAQLIARIPWALTGYNIPITGKNAASLAQNALDTVSPYPMQVTGHDGKVITYDKNRAINGPAVREYTFKGGSGGLLEFIYDTNSQYSDDDNALRQFKIDPETGALTQQDFLNSKDKIKVAENDTQRNQLLFDDAVNAQLDDLVLNNPEALSEVPFTAPYKKYSGMDYNTGNVNLVAQGPDQTVQAPTEALPRGNAQELIPAVDNTAWKKPLVSCPTPHLNEVKEAMENQVKHMVRGEQEQVKAHATILGDPQITSGVKVVFKGLAKRRNGAYFLTGCIHDIDPNAGYTTKFEMYFTGDISVGVNMNTATTSKDDIEKKAKDIKNQKTKMNPNADAIYERGYYLRSDFIKGPWEKSAEKVDKNWDTRMPGTFYQLHFTQRDGIEKIYLIKVPITTDGKTQDPIKAFGYDALYELLGTTDEVYIRTHLNYKVQDSRTPYSLIGEPEQYPDPAPHPQK